MNVEWSELAKTGQIEFSHPTGTNDDRLWALALAAYTSRTEMPEYHPGALTGRVWKSRIPDWDTLWQGRELSNVQPSVGEMCAFEVRRQVASRRDNLYGL